MKKYAIDRVTSLIVLAILLANVQSANKWNQAGTKIKMTVTGKVLSRIAIAQTKLTALTTDDKLVLSPTSGKRNLGLDGL